MKKLLLLSLLSAPSFAMNPIKRIVNRILVSKPAQFKLITAVLVINGGIQTVKAIK